MTARLPTANEDVLCRELAAMLVKQSPPIELAGGRFCLDLTPRSGADLSQALAVLSREEVSVVLRGGGSRMGLGNPARGAEVLLSLGGLAGVDEFDQADGVVHALAGTRLCDLTQRVEGAGWELPLDPPGAASTIGGVLASAATGPRETGFGPARDYVLGLDVVLASGERTRCGGRVVKNVTGYDLAKLYVGSFGTLGVIEGAWLRLRPSPREVLVRAVSMNEPGAAIALAREAARRPSARAIACVDADLARRSPALSEQAGAGPAAMLVCEFAGDPALCKADAQWLDRRSAITGAQRGEMRDGSEKQIAGLRELQTACDEGGLRVRISVLSSALESVCGALREAGGSLMVYPGTGIIHALFAPPGGEMPPCVEPDRSGGWIEHRLNALCAMGKRGEAEIVVEALPAWARPGRDVFGGAARSDEVNQMDGPRGDGALELMRGLKQRFDPHGLLNPGRFVAGL